VDDLVDVYAAAFVARVCSDRPDQPQMDEPGVRGLIPSADVPLVRLLVTDDRAYGVLGVLLPDVRGGAIKVFAGAARCVELLDRHPAWRSSETVTAMALRDLRTVPEIMLPGELTLRPVRRLADDAPDGVPLEHAVAAAALADPRIDDSPESFAAFLRSLPSPIRLFAAMDADGVVRATSAFGAFGTEANVFFVNTDPGWRGRGIGHAMTAAVLCAAREAGARGACLDATDAGLATYRRLGFEALTEVTRFVRVEHDFEAV
jgi:GNAT superfamily N-acetyltransferase